VCCVLCVLCVCCVCEWGGGGDCLPCAPARVFIVAAAGGCTGPALRARFALVSTQRGHQLTDWGFSFHTWAAAEEYVRDLALFGANALEFAHIDWARGDLASLSAYSKLLDSLAMNVSVWYVWPPGRARPVLDVASQAGGACLVA
jgi:hypothetical protein